MVALCLGYPYEPSFGSQEPILPDSIRTQFDVFREASNSFAKFSEGGISRSAWVDKRATSLSQVVEGWAAHHTRPIAMKLAPCLEQMTPQAMGTPTFGALFGQPWSPWYVIEDKGAVLIKPFLAALTRFGVYPLRSLMTMSEGRTGTSPSSTWAATVKQWQTFLSDPDSGEMWRLLYDDVVEYRGVPAKALAMASLTASAALKLPQESIIGLLRGTRPIVELTFRDSIGN